MTTLHRLVSLAAMLVALPASAANFIVNSTVDAVDALPGDGVCETVSGGGVCTLRAAILEANALAGADVVTLPTGRYVITIPNPGPGTDTPAVGDFDIESDLELAGAGPAASVLEGFQNPSYENMYRVLEITAGAHVIMSGVTIRGGVAPPANGGGGIANAGTLTLSDCQVRGNHVYYPFFMPGGGIYNAGTATITRCEIAVNWAWGNGGGIANVGTLVVEDSAVHDNAGSSGGGIANSGTLTVRNSSIAANRANGTTYGGLATSEGAGAGIFDAGGSATLEHATVSGNVVGGPYSPIGIYISDIYGTGSGVGVATGLTTSGLSLRSTIVAGNTHFVPGAIDNDCGAAPPTSLGHNLDGDGTCMLTGDADLPSTDPQLGPLADNGGPTPTMAISSASPALDAADAGACPAADQRGAPRPHGDGCDIGAYESNLPCGNAMIDPGEQCDDGSPGAGDCCSFLCAYEAVDTTCDTDGDPCTDDRCDGSGACALGATTQCGACETCRGPLCVRGPRALCRDPLEAGASTVIMKSASLVWRWTGEGTSSTDFGNPPAGDDYRLCVFDAFDVTGELAPRLSLDAELPGGPPWTGMGQPLGSRGFRYNDRPGTQAGITRVLLRPSAGGQSRVLVRGKVPVLDLYLPTIFQLQRAGGACWEADFTEAERRGSSLRLQSAATP